MNSGLFSKAVSLEVEYEKRRAKEAVNPVQEQVILH